MSDPDDRLERYVAGEMSADERRDFEEEILRDPALTDDLYRDVNVTAALESAARARREAAAGIVRLEPWWRRAAVRWLAPAAAAAAVVLVVWFANTPPSPHTGPTYRGGAVDTAGFSPYGPIETAPDRLVWEPFGDARYYRIELFDAASSRVLSAIAEEPPLLLDPELSFPRSGIWTVTPLDDVRVPLGDPVVLSFQIAD